MNTIIKATRYKNAIMLTRRFFSLSVLLIIILKSYAQVNLQTGGAVFSLPMFNWQDDKSRLNSVVALSYSSGSGLKVNDVASNVGQGWSMIAGGVISRMQVGQPDDQYPFDGNGDHSEKDVTKYPAGILYATVPVKNGCPAALTRYPLYGKEGQVYVQHNVIAEDKELDYFSFQFNGKAGMFVLDPTSPGNGQFIGDTKMKVTYETDAGLINLGIRTRITSFSIQDIDGLKYKFSVHGLSRLLQVHYCNPLFTEIRNQPKFKHDHVYYQGSFDVVPVRQWVISGWYLSEIEDVFTHRKIIFNYNGTDETIDDYAGEEVMYNSDKNYSVVARKRSISKMPQLLSISYPDQHNVAFTYGAGRIDLSGDKVLSSVEVSYNGRYLSKYLLKTSYFIRSRYGTPTTDYEKKIARLCLLSVQKIGVDLKEDSPPYIFDYYTGSTQDDFVPPRFFYAKDIWGFYNGYNSQGFGDEFITLNATTAAGISSTPNGNAKMKGLCFLNHNNSTGQAVLNAKEGFAKNGLLRQIVYPTGGTLTYEYLQNKVKSGSALINFGGVHVSKTSSTDGGNSNGCNTAVSTQYNYILSSGDPSLWGWETPQNWMTTGNRYQPEWKRYHVTIHNIPYGECFWGFQYPGVLDRNEATNPSVIEQIKNIATVVANIISVAMTVKDFVTVASGGNPAALIIDAVISEIDLAISCWGDGVRDQPSTVYYTYDLKTVSPLPTQFKRVEIVEGSGGTGTTIQEFTSDDLTPLWVGAGANTSFSSKQRFAPWAYGLPLKTTVKDLTGNIIKEVIYNYDISNVKHYIDACNFHGGAPLCDESLIPTGVQSRLLSCKCFVTKSYSQRSTNWTDPNVYNASYLMNSTSDMLVDFYGIYTGRVELSSTDERIYQPGSSDYVQTISNYIYNGGSMTTNNSNYEVARIETIQSNGDRNYKYFYYNTDYTGSIYTTLLNNNVAALPISSKTTLIRNNGSSELLLNQKMTELIQLSNGDIKPSRILEKRVSQPSANESAVPFKEIESFTYDNVTGNLIGVKDEGSRQISNIYDYGDKYVVATVINAEPLLDKPAYTSFETNNFFGGWTFGGSGSASYNTTSSVTGARSFLLTASTNLSATLNTGKPYTLSFWSTSSLTAGSGSTLIKSAPAINGFTYYEYDIAQGTTSISVSGNASIDELRLYPKTARMNSTSYDLLIGKTSECDANNRINYYEYDNLGRLRFIKDDYKNILKMYEYNNVSAAKQNGCPGTYSNKSIYELFTRNNCPGGQQGDTITFFVAAGVYSSAISQVDADAQAENYLLTQGQDFANTHAGCLVVYHNIQHTQNFRTQDCPEGYEGGVYTYVVPAGKYSSVISQADAEQEALDEIEANGQYYANFVYPVCNVDNNPHWVSDMAGTQCLNVDGVPHMFLLATDMNPNSSSYGQTSWQDTGPSDCTPQTGPNVTISGQNDTSVDQYVVFTNTVTNDQYFFSMGAFSSMQILGNIPSGNYNVQITDSDGWHTWTYEAGCNSSMSGSSGSFTNITIDSNCNTVIVHF